MRLLKSAWMGTESPVKNFLETDSWLIRGILLSSFLTAVGALFGIVALWMGKNEIMQRRRGHRVSAETDKNSDGAEETARVPIFPLAAFPVVFPCLYYLTHADLRYRQPIDPVVLLLTVVGVWGFVREDRAQNGST